MDNRPDIDSISTQTGLQEEPDEFSKLEAALLIAEHRTELESKQQDIEQRKEYGAKIYWLVVFWLLGLCALIVLSSMPWGAWRFDIPDRVLIALITGTTVNVLGLFAIVARYLFNPR